MCQSLQLEIFLYEWCLTEIQIVCEGLRQVLGASFPHYHVPSSCSVMEDERLQMKSGERWGDQEELLEKEFSQLGLALQDVRSWWHVSLPVLQCFPSLPREEFLDVWSLLSLFLVLDFWTCKYFLFHCGRSGLSLYVCLFSLPPFGCLDKRS